MFEWFYFYFFSALIPMMMMCKRCQIGRIRLCELWLSHYSTVVWEAWGEPERLPMKECSRNFLANICATLWKFTCRTFQQRMEENDFLTFHIIYDFSVLVYFFQRFRKVCFNNSLLAKTQSLATLMNYGCDLPGRRRQKHFWYFRSRRHDYSICWWTISFFASLRRNN